MKLVRQLFYILLLTFQILPTDLQAQNPAKDVAGKKVIRHSFFIAGPKFTGIIGENGEEIWTSNKPGARDGYVLPNGNILICWGDEVREYNGDKQVIFNFKNENISQKIVHSSGSFLLSLSLVLATENPSKYQSRHSFVIKSYNLMATKSRLSV